MPFLFRCSSISLLLILFVRVGITLSFLFLFLLALHLLHIEEIAQLLHAHLFFLITWMTDECKRREAADRINGLERARGLRSANGFSASLYYHGLHKPSILLYRYFPHDVPVDDFMINLLVVSPFIMLLYFLKRGFQWIIETF